MAESRDGRLFRMDVIVLLLIGLLLVGLILPAIQQAREAARRTQGRNNLQQLGLALQNYHDTFNLFPPGGTFAAVGTPMHSWTMFVQPYMAQVAPHVVIDYNRPWDDPVNISAISTAQFLWDVGFRDPAVPDMKTAAGLLPVHYSPNQWIMYRNSSVRLQDVPDHAHTLLMADAFGDYAAFGDPINWRDATLTYRTSPLGFGHTVRTGGTHVLFVDGHVDLVASSVSPQITATYAGPASLQPTLDLTAQRSEPYRVPDRPAWKYFLQVRGQKTLMKVSLSPNRKQLDASFGIVELKMRHPRDWSTDFARFAADMPIERVTVTGMLAADELRPFLALPQLKTLDLSGAEIEGDVDAVLATAPRVEVIRSP